ncbi:sensor histidine kinase [Clostridium intestinale]|uniref:Histidine kinase domain-containing protein n=1 Tax=Clostridium intestinale URNW TaxID=1294142 RepID=U2PSN3_9CLOT|nr:GHKL domain-containing protein [Clostridium intestinale]ERK29460.1 hypothetical protein CINTURNW_3255 [Clostridium intestinale URNW]
MIDSIFNFILTFMEISGIFLLWSKFNDFKRYNLIKYITLTIFMSILNNILVYSHLDYVFIINYAVIILLVKFLFKKSFESTIVEFVITIVLIMVMQLLVLAIFNISTELFNMVLFNNLAVKAFSINTLMITFILMIKKFVSYDKVLGNNGINIQLIYFYLISSLIYILVIKCVWEADYTIIEKNIVIFIVILLVYMAINFKFLKALISLIEEKKNLEAYNRYSKMTIDLVNDVKSKQHDFKNHLSTIYGIAQVSNEEDSKRKIKEYIEGLNESLSKEQYIISLDNRVLAGIIYSKLQRAEEMDIKFKYSINSDTNLMPVKDFELAEILFNLLDNAFEAVAKQDSSRWVELNIDREKENSIIHVRNSGVTLKNTNINEIFKKGFSTKGSQRGFGLYNIKSIVDKYGGSIEITTHNYITEFRLVFH